MPPTNILDLEQLLAPLAGEKPCGEDLSYDNEFQTLERDIEGTPERQMGETILPAEDPDWRQIQARALALFERTKDLRVAVFLVRALLRQSGVQGFAESLALISGLVQQHWQSLYPELDADDPAQEGRVNLLMALNHPPTVLNPLRTAPLVSFKGLGQFSERDVAIATGDLEPTKSDTQPVKMQTIDAAFARVELEQLQATAEALASASGHAHAIEQSVGEFVGLTNGPNFKELRAQLDRMSKIVKARLAQRQGSPEGEYGQDGGAAPTDGDSPSGGSGSGPIRNRDDVVRALDKIIEYFDRNEPSSPIPILLRRSQRLVRMDFADLIRDIAPDAIAHVDLLRGRTDPALNGGAGGEGAT